jgi:cytoskeleton protein RodZ
MAGTLGSLLRQKRESLGLTLEKVEGFTHIRLKHLQAIESDDLSSIPSVTQARGFIRNYASFLGFDPDDLAGLIGATRPRPGKPAAAPDSAAAVPTPQAAQPETPPAQSPVSDTHPRAAITPPVVSHPAAYAKSRPYPRPVRRRPGIRMEVILVGAVTLVIVALLGWGGYHLALSVRGTAGAPTAATFLPAGTQPPATGTPAMEGTEMSAGSEPAPSGTGSVETAGQTPGASGSAPAITPGTLSVATFPPTPLPTPLGGVYTDVRIHIIVVQRAFLEVTVDGKTSLSARVEPGETYDFIGRQTVTVATGNGAGIQVVYNGVDQGKMGRFGEVVTQIYTPTGIVTPVPEPTPTPTVTPTSTPTEKS